MYSRTTVPASGWSPLRIIGAAIGGFLFIMLVMTVLFNLNKVDETEHCFRTAYGKLVDDHVKAGPRYTGPSIIPWRPAGTELSCLPLTEFNYPEDVNENISVEVQTADPLTIPAQLSLTITLQPENIKQTWLAKRNPEATKAEIIKASLEGFANAIAKYRVDSLFYYRANIPAAAEAAIERKVGGRADVRVFLKHLGAPKAIEDARVATAKQQLREDSTRAQFRIDSLGAFSKYIAAEYEARATDKRGEAYRRNPELLQLDRAKAVADGIAKACNGVTNCVLGGSVMDTWRGGN